MNSTNQERQRLRDLAHGFYFSCSLFATVRLGLADALVSGAKSKEELSRLLNADEAALKRLITFMISLKIMEEKDGKVHLTESGEFLSSRHPQSLAREISMFSGEETYRAWGNVIFSVRTGKPAFNQVFGSSLFEYFADHRDTAGRFHAGWQEITTTTAKEFVHAYTIPDNSKVLDVGSGYGVFLCTVIQENLKLNGALYDLAVSLEGAPEVIKKHGLEGKVSLIPGDATKSVPRGFTVHILKSLIHNCNDEQSIRMLSNCAASLERGNRVLIVERIVPANGDYHWSKLVDMTMLVMTGGQERTEEEYGTLCKKSGLKLTRVIGLPSGFSVMECFKE